MSRICLAALLLAVFLTGAAVLRTEANAGPPYYFDGNLVAEPTGLTGVRIDHETLEIDMRGLPAAPPRPLGAPISDTLRTPIFVTATYTLVNDGDAREVGLVFATGAPNADGFAVTLDGGTVPAHVAPELTLPAAWQPPATTPGLDGQDLLYLNPKAGTYESNTTQGWGHYDYISSQPISATYAFTVTILPGESALVVHYRSAPQQLRSGGYSDKLESYQFAYVLAPARAWDGFGGMDVTINLPACWEAASRPPLTHIDDELYGSFDTVPADALAMTVAPCPTARQRANSFCPTPALALPIIALGLMLRRCIPRDSRP